MGVDAVWARKVSKPSIFSKINETKTALEAVMREKSA